MEARRINLENADGKTLRTFLVSDKDLFVIHRKDTKRLEVLNDVQALVDKKIDFKEIGRVKRENLAHLDFDIPGVGKIKASQALDVQKNVVLEEDNQKLWYTLLFIAFLLASTMLSFLLSRTNISERLEEELKQQVVKIVKNIPVQQTKPKATVSQNVQNPTTKTNTKVAKDAVRRAGALGVLGSLKASNQRGGLNLNAAQTTAGPGLGGTAGSGGVQTSLYGKGIVAAPLGAGGNVQGGGGYGTKGKGGGQAGYGTMSLVGSAGANPIPVGAEATIGGGLDRDMIADVINRNLGQVRFCYEQGLQGDPNLKGRVAVGFTISGAGMVKTAGVESTTLNSKLVEDCILLRMKTWKFPLPQGGVDVKVSYPFVLKRAGQG
jgi:hypothetical protein